MSPGNPRAEVKAQSRSPQREQIVSAKVNVCHVASGDRWAGAEVQVATLLKNLAKQPGLELSAILLNPGRLAEEIRNLGVESLVIPENETGFFGLLLKAAEFLRSKRISVLHSHRYKENLLASLLARRLGIPALVRTQHGSVEPQRGLKELKRKLIHGIDGLTARWNADCVIGVSAELTQRLVRDFGAEKVRMVPNGVDVEQVKSCLTIAEARQRLGIPPDCFVLGTAGRLEPVKRLDIFLEAARRIAEQHAATRFIVAGDGSERTRLTTLARDLGVAERVHFLGHRNDIFDVLRAFDIMVLSSDHEGLPMVLLEALALGVVVVARNVGGIPEVIQDGISGVLVATDSPAAVAAGCLELLADEDRRQRLAQEARNRVIQEYSATMTAERTAQIYRSVLDAK